MRRKLSRPKAPTKSDIDKLQQRRLARVDMLCSKLIGIDYVNSFADNCAITIHAWHCLLYKSTLSADITRTDPRIAAAFKAVDDVITGKEGTYLLRRLAFIQLMRIFVTLESIIRHERDKAQVERSPCYRASSVAMDLYVSCQESDLRNTRDKLKERKRTGRSWVQLAGPSPFLALLYSEAAEPILFVLRCVRFLQHADHTQKGFQKDRPSKYHHDSCESPFELSSAHGWCCSCAHYHSGVSNSVKWTTINKSRSNCGRYEGTFAKCGFCHKLVPGVVSRCGGSLSVCGANPYSPMTSVQIFSCGGHLDLRWRSRSWLSFKPVFARA